MSAFAGTPVLPDATNVGAVSALLRRSSNHPLKTALDPLYAALSDEQKKTADEIMPGPMGMGMMMM